MKGGRYYFEDGKVYTFDRVRFRKEFDRFKAGYGTAEKAKAFLAESAHYSPETVSSHLKKNGSSPDEETCRLYGRLLAEDERAFLRPMKTAEEEQEYSVYKIHDDPLRDRDMQDETKAAYRDIVRKVYGMLYDILSQYEASEGFNYVPGTEDSDSAWAYFDKKIEMVRREAMVDLLWMEDTDMELKIERVIRETEIFVKSYSVPGVVPRWREISSGIGYFDPVYEAMETMPPEAFEKAAQMGLFSFIPTNEQRSMYMFYIKMSQAVSELNNLGYSPARLFQNQLLTTLQSVFRHDFSSLRERD